MPVPSPRNKILPARGNYADLASNVASLLDGEICYAIDQDQYYQNEGGTLVAVGATKAQGILADSAVQPGDNISTLTNDAGYITSAQAPVQSVAGKTGVVTLVKGDVGLGNVDNTSDLDKPISTATQTALDLKADLVGGVIPNSQLPSLAISEYLGSVASEAAMLALVGQRGDWAIRTDTGSTWVITTDGGSLLSDWTELATPADAVTSVNGYTGTVVLGKADVGLGNVDNTSDLNKPISTATQTALNLKADLASPALTGTPTAPTATAGTNTTQLATTAFVSTAVANKTTNFNDLTNKTAGTGNYTTTGTFTGNTLASTVATGTAPLTVASTTLVTNLNADQLDGVEGSSFLRSDADDSFTGTITGISDAVNPVLTIDGPGPNIVRFLDNGSTTAGLDVAFKTTPNTLGIQSSATADTFLTIDADTPSGCITLRGGTNNPDPVKIERGGASSDQVALQFAATGARWFGKGTDNNPYWSSSNDLAAGDKMWHAGNDGPGSGLDADLLDGQEGSYYLNTATNFGGDVSGTYDNIVIANDSHTHAFDNLTGKTSGTGDYTTTGDFTSAAVIPTGATVPTNGMYLPSANQVGFATNSAFKFGVDSLDGNPLFENNYPTIRPTLDLRFAATKKLDPRITFTRASTGTYTDQFGVLQTAATNQARFDHDPTTGESLGLLVEEQRQNLLLRSEEFDQSPWAPQSITYETNAITAPNGTLTADKIVENTSAGVQHRLDQAIATVTNQTYAFSVYVKAGETPSFVIQIVAIGSTATTSNAGFSISGGVITFTSGIAGIISAASAVSVGNGWYRCSVIYTLNGTVTSHQVRIYPRTTTTYTGDGTSGIYVWGAQLEAGAFPTSYIPTTSATVTRAADVASITGTNFSSWYRQDEGTFCGSVFAPKGTVLYGTGATFDNTQYIANAATGNVTIRSGGANSAILDAAVSTTGTTKTAWTYKENDMAATSNGGSISVDTSGAVPVGQIRLKLGSSAWETGGGNNINGHIRRLTYWPQRLSNATLQAITQ